ncbi:MAG TPA: hypothetical protein VFN61_06380 [Acidimicrobiales bacterium]|nr:hypothetical protein [Acidimicrobiales bacterium]
MTATAATPGAGAGTGETGPKPAQSWRSGPRAAIKTRTLRTDRWWAEPAVTATVLLSFVVYSTWAAFQNANYYKAPYLSPFYSPCIATVCQSVRDGAVHGVHAPTVGIVGPWWAISPAILILIVPLGFRFSCYYYRKAYYRAIWQSPTACAVGEPHKRYKGESRFPLILQNVHRYFFYLGLLLNCILTWDAVEAYHFPNGWGMGFGSLMLTLNAVFLWSYSLSCHSCRHIVGGRLKHFSKHPLRYKFWGFVSKLNTRHMQIAWVSLIFVALTDLYVRLYASGWVHDPRFF